MNWYELGYRECPCFWGSASGSLVGRLPGLVDLSTCRVLDLGAGEGKNAYFCAAKGAEVVAVEVSETAIRHGIAHFGSSERVSWVNQDVMDFEIKDSEFDVVICYGLTHCLPSADHIVALVERLKAAVPVGGLHVLCAFNSRHQELDRAHPGFKPTLLSHALYSEFYSDWDLHSLTDTDLRERHPNNMLWHTHSMTRLIAERK